MMHECALQAKAIRSSEIMDLWENFSPLAFGVTTSETTKDTSQTNFAF